MSDEEFVVVDNTPQTPVIREVPKEPSNLKRNISLAIWVTILVGLALFIGQNWRSVRMDFLFWNFSIRLSFALLAAAAFGVLLGFSIPFFWRRRGK